MNILLRVCAGLLGSLALSAAIEAQVQFLAAGDRNLFPFSQVSPTAIACGDVDGDGDTDAVLAGSPTASLWLYSNDAFDLPPVGNWPTLPDASFAVALTDVDGDGDLDVVLATSRQKNGPAEDRLLLNDGTGKFTDASTQLPASRANNSASVAVGDLTGDGKPDLVFGGPTGIRVYVKTSSGYTTGTPPSPSLQGIFQLALLDLDGDNDLDLLATSVVAPAAAFRNDGTGKLTAIIGGLPSIPSAGRFSTGDIDGDGDADLVVGRLTANPTRPVPDQVLINNGNGKFTNATATWLPTSTADAGNTVANVLVDVTGDNKLDLLVLHAERRSLLYTNTGTKFDPISPALGPIHGPNNVCTLDVDNDGDNDFLVTAFADGLARPALLVNFRQGFFMPKRTGRLEAGANAVAITDFNRDGAPDIVIGRSTEFGLPGPGRVEGFVNDNFGRYGEDPAFSVTVPENIRSVLAADWNGDNRVDLFVATTAGTNRLLLQNSSGGFTDATSGRLPSNLRATAEAVALDVDGDGDLDLLTANEQAHGSLLLNDGTGKFTDASTKLPISAGTWQAITLADVDGDRDQDVILAGKNKKALFLQNSGVFTDASPQLGGANADFTDVAVGDVDGDGDIDLLFAGTGAAPTQTMLLNNGSGRFTPNANFKQVITSASSAILVDFDRDGDLDTLLTNRSYPAELQRNDGTGKFTRAPIEVPAQSTGVIAAAADLDFDGDQDVVIAGRPVHVLLNTHIHTRGRRLARLGGYFSFDVFARPGYAPGNQQMIFLISTGRAAPPISLPIGRFGLNAAALVVVPGLPLPASASRHFFEFAIPRNNFLAEATLHFQAVVTTTSNQISVSNVATERIHR